MTNGLTGARAGAQLAIAVAALSCAASVRAAELDYQVAVGAAHSDNVTRVATAEVDEDIATASLRFALDQRTARLRADVVGDLAYNKYLDDTYEADVLGNVYADTAFSLIPDRIVWNLRDQFGQVLGDPFAPATPENRENINYLSTGPDFYVGMGPQMRLRLGVLYSLVDYEDSPLDSTTAGAQLALVRVISDRSSVSLNANLRQVDYDEESLAADRDETEMYLHYENEGARTNLSVDAGYSRLDRDAFDESESGPLVRLDASRRISASSRLSLQGGREFSTAASAFTRDQGVTNVGLDTAPGRQTSEPFTLDSLVLGWDFNRNVTSLAVTGSWSNRSYVNEASFDETLTGMTARFGRDLSPTTSISLVAAYNRVEFEGPALDFQDFNAGASFSWRLSRALTLSVRYDLFDRSSDSAASEYTENRIWLTLGFGRGDPRATRVAPTFGVDSVIPAGN